MLTGALGTYHIIPPKVIHTLAAVDRVAVCGGQCIRQILLTAKAIAAILRLTVYNISGNADGTRVLLNQRYIVTTCAITGRHGRHYLVGASVAAVNAVIFVNKRLVSMLLCSEGSGHVFAAFHHAAALVIQTYNRWHAVPTWTALEGWSNRFVVSNAARFCACSGGKTGNKGLLLHPRLCAQRTRHIAQIPHLVPLVGGKSNSIVSTSAIHSSGFAWPRETCLNFQCAFQLWGEFLAALKGSAQNSQTGFRGQIVF